MSMRILFLDVASHEGLIAAVTADAVVASQSVDHRIGDRDLVPAIDAVLKAAGWKHGEITNVACVTGPGGFTSVRVGVSAANAFAWALGIPACGVHLSDLYAARVAYRDCIWLHSTKKNALFLRGFGTYASLAPDAQLHTLDDALRVIPTDAPLIGELISEHQAVFVVRGQHLQPLLSIADVLPSFLAKQRYDQKTLQPWYGRGW